MIVQRVGRAACTVNLQLPCQLKRLFQVRLLRGRQSGEGAYEFNSGSDILKRPGAVPFEGTPRSLHGIVQLAPPFHVLRQLHHQVHMVGSWAPVGSAGAFRQYPKCNRLGALKHE